MDEELVVEIVHSLRELRGEVALLSSDLWTLEEKDVERRIDQLNLLAQDEELEERIRRAVLRLELPAECRMART